MRKKDKHIYPAVFTYEDGYEITVSFPDLPGCTTSGKDEAEALAMAKEALGIRLWRMESDKEKPPTPSALRDIDFADNECAVLIDTYMPAVRLSQENKAINRTVTLPAWLNAASLEKGVNFSQVLQSALMTQLGISKARR